MEIFGILLTGRTSGGEGVFFAVVGAIIITIIYSAITKISSSNSEKKLNKEIELSNKAKEYFDNDNFINAIEYYLKVLNTDKNNIEALEGIALSYHLMKEYDNSKKYIDKFQDIFDKIYTSGIITYLQGHFYFMEGNLEKASNCKQKAIEFGQSDNILHKGLLEVINRLNLY